MQTKSTLHKDSSWEQIFGKNIKEFTPEKRRQNWLQMKQIFLSNNDQEIGEYWENYEGCFDEKGVCKHKAPNEGWCNLQSLPCGFNPITKMIGMACMGMDFEPINNQSQMNIQEILAQCIVDGLFVRLPEGQLDRKVYQQVKSALELIGGKWKGGKTQAFVFEQDPTELLQAQINGEQRNLKKEFQFFATPPELAREMARMLTHRLIIGDKILEPSAGDGALIKAIWDEHGHGISVDCFEAMDLNKIKLSKIEPIQFLGDDFLKCSDKDNYYDYILANPPFTKNQDIIHIAKMYQCLKPGGTLVTLSSPSWTFGSLSIQENFSNWLVKELNATIKFVDEGTFKSSGTSIRTVLIKIQKPETNIPEIPEVILKKMLLSDLDKDAEILKAEKEIEEIKKERTCRVCGCKDNDCRQCIKKTGQPCTWVENDLCSACYLPPPEEIMKSIEEKMKESQQIFNDLKNMISPQNNIDMDFFEQLAKPGNVDMTIRIMQKGGTLTLNIMPGSGASVTKPMIMTGSPQDLDEKFFSDLYPQVNEVVGIINNIKSVKYEAEQKQAEASAKKIEKAIKPESKKTKEKPKTKKKVLQRDSLFEDDDHGEESDEEQVSDTPDDDNDLDEN